MEINKTAIVLGGTAPHCELINQLKNRGYYTVLVDYLKNPPAAKVADIHIRESTLDKETVYQIAERYSAALVIATCIDHANSTACYVLEKMRLPAPYSYQTSLNMTDKQRMKTILKENGIPTAEFQIVSSAEEEIHIPFPVVIKPVDSNGSRGVCKIESENLLHGAIENALSASKTGRAIVEAYIGGKEASVYCYVLDGEAHVILSNLRYVMENVGSGLMPGVRMVYPNPFTEKQAEAIKKICQQSAKAFKLSNTPLLIQVKYNQDDAYVIELMPRIGGGQSYWNIKELTGFDMISAAIDSFEGKKPVMAYHEPSYITATNHLYATAGRFSHVANLEKINASGLVEQFSVLRSSGSNIVSDLSSGNRVCSYVVKGKDMSEISEKIRKVNSMVDIIDVDGNSVLRHDMIPEDEAF